MADTTATSGWIIPRLVEELKLSRRQEIEVRSIIAQHREHAQRIEARYADAPGARTRAAGLGELRALRERTDTALLDVLNEKQMAQFRRLREDFGQDFLERREDE